MLKKIKHAVDLWFDSQSCGYIIQIKGEFQWTSSKNDRFFSRLSRILLVHLKFIEYIKYN